MEAQSRLSSKYQITLPSEMRRALGLVSGDKIIYKLDKKSQRIIIEKPQSIDAISKRLTSYIKPQKKPLENVDEYYQQYRKGRA